MEQGVYPPDAVFANLPETMDSDLMDELLSGGCWLETANGATDFLQPDPSSTNFFEPFYFLPSPEISNNPKPPESNTQEETKRSAVAQDPPSIESHTHNSHDPQPIVQNIDTTAECSSQVECYSAEENSELRRRWWIGPRANSGPVTPVRDRLFWALRRIQDSLENRHVLIQIWVPIKRDGRQILTTDDQPFSFDCNSQSLASYRDVSTQYQFPTDKNSSESIGLPGHVYLEKAFEWTPDVQLFSSDEYPRVGFAHQYNVHGSIALPIFEQGSRSCLGVLEVVTTTWKTKYRSELNNICEALEAVDLRSSEVSSSTHIKAWNESNRASLPEIVEVLKAVCETYNLPLAQTWVPCIQQGKGGCQQSDDNHAYCLSTVDSACCVTDPRIQGFHEACAEHQLLRGQGVVGRALMTNEPCFLSDITSLSKKEYPLVHYAKIFGLRAAVAIRLRSIYSGTIDYVLEFFLPLDCIEFEEQKTMLKSLSIVVQRVCQSLRVVTDEELQVETVPQVGEKMYGLAHGPSKMLSQSTWINHMMESQQKSIIVRKEETEGFKLKSNWGNPEGVLQQQQTFSDFKQQNLSSRQKSSVECGEDSSIGEGSLSSAAKPVEKRRTKAEKSISLQVLRQYFAGSLKDAAKSIGVCPTTLKRICRQHGITRWPSRKIKKVGHSLRKLQVVIDSVQGAEGAFQIGSFYTNFPELTSPNIPGSNLFPTMKVNDNLKTVNTKSEGVPSAPKECVLSPLATGSKTSSSSCSQSSSSSLSCSLGKQQTPLIADLTDKEDSGMMNVLKRTRSDVELLAKEELGLLKRSQSHKSLSEHPRLIRPAFPKSKRQVSRDRAAIRVKVTYGEERVRFSMQSSWRFGDLQQEIAKRFHIDDMSGIDLKYLDDDSEWVLLTCDADVEECIDVYNTSSAHTIKLSVHQVSHPNLGSSLGSHDPS